MKKLLAIIILLVANEIIGILILAAFSSTSSDYVTAFLIVPAIFVFSFLVYVTIVGIWWAINELF